MGSLKGGLKIKKEIYLTPCKAIRKFCIECMGSQKAPRNCENIDCPLFIYRLGTNPKRKGIGGNKVVGKKRQPVKIIPSQDVRTIPLETIIEGKKRIRVIVEDIED